MTALFALNGTHSLTPTNPGLTFDWIAERLFALFDKGGSGRIDFEEFIAGLALCCRGDAAERARFLFEAHDLAGDGAVSRSELRTLLNHLPPSVIHAMDEASRERERMESKKAKAARVAAARARSGSIASIGSVGGKGRGRGRGRGRRRSKFGLGRRRRSGQTSNASTPGEHGPSKTSPHLGPVADAAASAGALHAGAGAGVGVGVGVGKPPVRPSPLHPSGKGT